jgi:hypothetical protein
MVFDALPIDLSGLEPEPEGAQSSRAPSGRDIPAIDGRMASNAGLGGLVLRGSRGCSIWTGVRVLVDMLMGRST